MAFKNHFIEFQNLNVNDKYLLRQVKPEKDIDAYFVIYSDSDVFRYYSVSDGCTDKERIMVILNNQIKAFDKMREYTWTIVDEKTDFALGRIHLSDFQNNNKTANIGYFLNKTYWGKGIISACIKPVVKFGFEYLKLERIYTTVMVENAGSWKALEKNGFIREGTLRHSFQLKDGLYDCYMYSRLYTD